MMFKKYAVLICIAISVILMVIAAQLYPGGSILDKNSTGFDWTRNFISNLFGANAINGAENGGRIWAIIGMARALGESAPLLMIGMVAFIVDIPRGTLDPATVLPVQIYLWADSPERAFVERTSAAILVLLAFLIVMNGLAVYLRKRYERRW